MEFVEAEQSKTWVFESDDGTRYRSNENGTVWERLYDESWEPVCGDEETKCYAAFDKRFSGITRSLVSKNERLWDFYSVGPVQRAAVEDFTSDVVEECISVLTYQLYLNDIDQSDNPFFYKAVTETKQHFGMQDGN